MYKQITYFKGVFILPNVKFKDIYNTLKDNIDNGKYDASMMLPTEMELVNTFNCSRKCWRMNKDKLVFNELGSDFFKPIKLIFVDFMN